MKIELDGKPMENKKRITFEDLKYGEIFRVEYQEKYTYGIKIVGFAIDEQEFNCVDLEDGEAFYLCQDDEVELYDDSLKFKADRFIKEK